MSSNLVTHYLGLRLESPVIIGACPLTIEPEAVRQMFAAGAAAVVLPSILQEQIVHAQLMKTEPDTAAERSGYQPQQDKYNGGPESYLASIEQLKSRLKGPIIASMNGSTGGSWLDFAVQIEASGADALELNLQPIVSDPALTSEEIENTMCDIVKRVCESVALPVAVKLSQRTTNLALLAHKMQAAGAAGVTLFAHEPRWDVCIDQMHWTVRWELSPLNSLGVTLEGLIRARAGGLDVGVAASGGIRTAEDAVKAMVAGADVVMVTSELYRAGPDAVRDIVDGIGRYIDGSRHDCLMSFQKSRPPVSLLPDHMKRLEYLDPLTRPQRYSDPTPVASVTVGDRYGHKT